MNNLLNGIFLFLLMVNTSVNVVQAEEVNKTSLEKAQTPLSVKACHLKGIKEQVKCGTLLVPENYQLPNGTKIKINFAIIPAIDNSQAKLPFLFLAGGPGQAAVELASPMLNLFKEVRKTHDILFIDQRGTGKSNPITCDEVESKNVYELTPDDFSEQEINDCIAQFKGDLTQFTSENSIRDFDAVRQALGLKQLNIYGGSYGTRAALVYMNMFPASLRSVVLDSVGPLEVPIGPFGLSSANSFKKLEQHCQQNKACHQAFPNLQNEFEAVMKRFETPVSVAIQHPRLGTETELVLSQEKFINILRMQLYNVQTRTLVPLVIHQAYLKNYRPIAGLLAQTDGGMGLYVGLTFNIVCNEDYPRLSAADWQKDGNNSFGKNASHSSWQKACPIWPQYRPSADFYKPVTADIPTLILSGGIDPVTPPSNGDYPMRTLPNSHHIIVENSAHIVASHSCAPLIISEFIEKLTPKALDESCLKDVPKEKFMTSLNGNN